MAKKNKNMNLLLVSEIILVVILFLLNYNYVMYLIFGGLAKFFGDPIDVILVGALIFFAIKMFIKQMEVKPKDFFQKYMPIGIILILIMITISNLTVYQPGLEKLYTEIYGEYDNEKSYDNFKIYSDEYISLHYPNYFELVPNQNSYIMLVTTETNYTSLPEIVMLKFHDSKMVNPSDYEILLGLKSNIIDGGKVIEHENSTLGGYEAIKVVYEYEQEFSGKNYKVRAMRVTSILDELIIQIIFTSDPIRYETYIEDIEKLVESFRLK